MTNDPLKNKLSSQFGDIVGPSDSELAAIEGDMYDEPEFTGGTSLTPSERRAASGAGEFFTPEMTEDFRSRYSGVDPNYTALRNSRQGRRGAGTTDFGITPAADRSAAAVADNPEWLGTELTGGFKNTGNTSDFDRADTHGSYRGSSLGGSADVEAGKRASPFDVYAPRTPMEKLQREIGNWYLHLAGPTCNHVRCRAIRARGLELIGRPVATREFASIDPEKVGMAFAEPIPSVRKDTSVPVAKVRPEAAGKAHKVGSYGTGKTNDTGDFEMDRKNPITLPQYVPEDPKDPRWVALTAEWKANSGRGPDVAPIFHPDEYLEHHHYPGEEFEPLPWEE